MIIIFTDGAGRTKGTRAGAWGAVLTAGKHQLKIGGAVENTTSQRMELTAAVRALEELTTEQQITLVSDSQYLIKGITEWVHNWRACGWVNSSGLVKNRDLWERLLAMDEFHSITWIHMRGHGKDTSATPDMHEYNHMADRICATLLEEYDRTGQEHEQRHTAQFENAVKISLEKTSQNF